MRNAPEAVGLSEQNHATSLLRVGGEGAESSRRIRFSTLSTLGDRVRILKGLLAFFVFCAPLAHAQDTAHHDVKIESQPIGGALKALAAQTGLQVLVFSQDAGNKRSPSVHGSLTNEEALLKILDDSGLTYEKIDDNTVAIRKKGTSPASATALHSTRYDGNSTYRVARSDDPPQFPANSSSAGGGNKELNRSSDSNQLEEILVTARKRQELLQDVPISITAVSSETIEKTGTLTLEDLGRQVPGLSIASAGPGQNQLTLRGLSGGSTVGYYLDDTPLALLSAVLPGTNVMDAALIDLNRVEVLRGPQGTLYGASSLGGTVRYITNQPDLTATHAFVKTTLSYTDGGGPNEEVDALINAPLVPEYAGLRVVAFERYYDGYIDRYPTDPQNYLAVLSGPVDRNVNTEKTYGTRGSLEIKPIDAVSVTLSALYQRIDLGAPFTFDSPPGSFNHPIQSRLVNEPYSDRTALYTLTVQGDVHAVHITSSTSYFDRTNPIHEDASKAAYYLFTPSQVYPSPLYFNVGNRNFTQELRASGSVGPVHALVGVFYSHAVEYDVFNWATSAGYAALFGSQPALFATFDIVDVQKALFSELNFDIRENLQFTVGARVFRQTRSQVQYATGVLNGGIQTLTSGTSAASGTTPKYGISYHLTPDIMAYATAAQGFREGGPVYALPDACNADLANIGLTTHPTSFQPDKIWSYEMGAKTAWLDHRLTINGDIYYIDWTNVQQEILLPVCGYNFMGNFGTASSKGAELEMHYHVASGLQLGLGVAFNQAQITSTAPGAQGQVGQNLEYAPRWMGSASIEYDRSLGAETSAYARIDFNTTSHEYNNFNTQSTYYSKAGYSLANLRFGAKRKSWQSSLFVTNLFDKHAETALPLSNAIDLPTTRRYSLNRPRTIGLDVRLDY